MPGWGGRGFLPVLRVFWGVTSLGSRVWAVVCGGAAVSDDKADELRGRLAEVLSDPGYGTSLSSWNDQAGPPEPLHLKPAEPALR